MVINKVAVHIKTRPTRKTLYYVQRFKKHFLVKHKGTLSDGNSILEAKNPCYKLGY